MANTTRRAPAPVTPVRSDFDTQILAFSSRPRLKIGDLAEFCRGCLPSNRGKRVRIIGFEPDGWVTVRSLDGPTDSIDLDTGVISRTDDLEGRIHQNNLYRISNLSY